MLGFGCKRWNQHECCFKFVSKVNVDAPYWLECAYGYDTNGLILSCSRTLVEVVSIVRTTLSEFFESVNCKVTLFV